MPKGAPNECVHTLVRNSYLLILYFCRIYLAYTYRHRSVIILNQFRYRYRYRSGRYPLALPPLTSVCACVLSRCQMATKSRTPFWMGRAQSPSSSGQRRLPCPPSAKILEIAALPSTRSTGILEIATFSSALSTNILELTTLSVHNAHFLSAQSTQILAIAGSYKVLSALHSAQK